MGGTKEIANIDPPAYSDGAWEAAWPCADRPTEPPPPPSPAAEDGGDSSSRATSYWRKVDGGQPMHELYLLKLGAALKAHRDGVDPFAGEQGSGKTGTASSVRLSRLPDGYALFTQVKGARTDTYLFGRKGKKYRSPKEFVPHLIWLESVRDGEEPDNAKCACPYCPGKTPSLSGRAKRKHDEGSARTEETPTRTSSSRKGRAHQTPLSEEGSPSGKVQRRPAAWSPLEDANMTGGDLSSERSVKSRENAEGADEGKSLKSDPRPFAAPPDPTKVPTFWEGCIKFKDVAIEVLILRLQLGPANEVLSPRDTYWAPCPVFSCFPLDITFAHKVPAAVAEKMCETARAYIDESLKRTAILWAYHVLVMPSFRPSLPGATRESNTQAYDALREQMKLDKVAAYAEHDNVMFLLKPTGSYLTGFAVVQGAIISWAGRHKEPL